MTYFREEFSFLNIAEEKKFEGIIILVNKAWYVSEKKK